MNRSNFWSLPPARGCRHVLGCAFILLGAVAATTHTFAEQSATAAPPPEVDPPALTTIDEPLPKPVDDVALNGPPPVESYAIPPAPSEGGKQIYGAGAGITSAPKRFQWGARLTIRGVYDDNILLSHFDRIHDWYVAIEPAITIGYGDSIVGRNGNYIRLDYAPSIFLYTDHSDDDSIQHLIRLEGQYRFGRLILGLSQDVQILHGSHLDTSTLDASAISVAGSINAGVNGRTHVDIYRTNAGASYDLSDKTFLSSEFHYVRDDFNTLISSDEIYGNLFFNYKYSPRLAFGIGGGAGFNTVDLGPDSTFEQGLLRVEYQLTGKISLNATAGVEVRQFDSNDGGSRGDEVTGVYEIGAVYQPFDGTVITLRGSSRVLNSAVVANADYLATNVLLGVRQRLLQRVYVGFTAGYEHAHYFPTINGVDGAASRDDNYYLIEPAVDVMVTRWCTVGAYYLYRTNDSPIARFDYYENQVGMRASFTY
jgi:putative salt-induced outer membrane protein YdiY